jgi:hypothetical protein
MHQLAALAVAGAARRVHVTPCIRREASHPESTALWGMFRLGLGLVLLERDQTA